MVPDIAKDAVGFLGELPRFSLFPLPKHEG
jgi:hypothetical protein